MMATIQGISYDDLGRLGVDENHRLYWDGQPLVTGLALARWVNVALVIGAASTLLMAVLELLRFCGFGSGG